jgi:hypothetical protein
MSLIVGHNDSYYDNGCWLKHSLQPYMFVAFATQIHNLKNTTKKNIILVVL